MTAALAWLATTRAGRWLAAGAGALVALDILARVYGAGRATPTSTDRPTPGSAPCEWP